MVCSDVGGQGVNGMRRALPPLVNTGRASCDQGLCSACHVQTAGILLPSPAGPGARVGTNCWAGPYCDRGGRSSGVDTMSKLGGTCDGTIVLPC